MDLKTRDEVKAEFQFFGKSIAEWARNNGFSEHLVYQVLSGTNKGHRGQSHAIAVALGLKRGSVEQRNDSAISSAIATVRNTREEKP